MIGLTNKDSSFFTVKLLNTTAARDVRQEDIQRLIIIEEMDRMPHGTLQLNDPNHVYSRILRNGVMAEVTWGYKKRGVELEGAAFESFTDLLERRGMRTMVTNPSGGGSSAGQVTYNCNLLAVDIRGLKDHVVYSSGTRGSMIRTVFSRLGITETDVRFRRANEVLTADTGERQWETDFAFLARKAREWRVLFRIGEAPDGSKIGLFIDPDYLPTSPAAKRMVGGKLELNYLAGAASNVSEYNWSCNEGENGAGDNVQLVLINGELTVFRYTVEGEKVKTWRLNTDRIKRAFDERETGDFRGLTSQADLVREVYAAKDFDDPRIKQFFDPVESETAPNGLGYTINVRMLGNPAAVPPCIPTFGEGFPDRFRPRRRGDIAKYGVTNNIFYVRSSTHTIDTSGYHADLEIVDVYTLSPVGELFG